MTNLTDEQREFLATEVIGWELIEDFTGGGNEYFYGIPTPDDSHFQVWKQHWKPDQNIEQAFMLLDKFGDWDLGVWDREIGTEIYCRVFINWKSQDSDGEAISEEPSEAICNAVLQAEGWEDE